MKNSLLALFVALGLLTLAGCSKKYAELPSYSRIVVSPDPVHGEAFVPEIKVNDPGEGFSSAEFTVTITNGKKTYYDRVKVLVYDPCDKDPLQLVDANGKQVFVLNDPGTYEISCKAELKTKYPLKSGQIAASASMGSSSFNVK